MAKEEKIEKIQEPIREEKVEEKSFKVIKAFTADKYYRRGSVFISSNKTVIERLINNQNIK